MAATTPHQPPTWPSSNGSPHIPRRTRNGTRITAASLSRHTTDGVSVVSLDGHSNITAAATTLTSRRISRLKGVSPTSSEQWQRRAWDLFDVTPELAYVARFEGNAISRAVLVAARLPDNPEESPQIVKIGPDGEPPDNVRSTDEPISSSDRAAAMAMSDFLGGRTNQTQELARVSQHLMVPGVSYIVMYDDEDGSRVWMVLSNEEVSWTGAHWKLRVNGEDVRRPVDDTLVIRIWTPHGRNRWQADSPVRHLLPVLSELESLTKHVSATVDSRLAGAGLLVLPQEMDFPHDPSTVPDGVDPFLHTLTETMAKAIEDRDVAAAHVPITIKVPADVVDKINHIKFATDLDDQTRELRDEAVRRVALGVDFPPEILLGQEGLSHWGSWYVEDAAIKLHIEPKLQVICHAATVGYLHPYLKALGVEDWDRYVCWYDITQIKLRPNRSADAQELWDDLLINDQARMRAAGFDSSDMPDDEELKRMLVRKIVVDAPQLAMNFAPLMGIEPIVYDPAGDTIPGSRDQDPADPREPSRPAGVNNSPESHPEPPTPGAGPQDSTAQPRENNTTRPGPGPSRKRRS